MAERQSSSRRSRGIAEGAIGHFVVDGEIGKGSFAQVYSAHHKVTGAMVAIKSVDLSRLTKKLKENLYSEIKILKRLRHPHIVALHDCVESTSHINLIMEYCEMGDLSVFIKRRDKLVAISTTHELARKYPVTPGSGLNEVVSRHFLKQLASAIRFLREANLIHRDIKPQNLLLLPPKQSFDSKVAKQILSASRDSLTPAAGIASLPMLKLADFGFARVLPSTSLAETLCGSPLYMAPEILRYERYDAKADLWSVGTVLYEMTTGKPPFRAGNHVELLRKIEAAEDVIKFSRDSVVTPEMKALIRALLKRNPVERMAFEDFFNHIVVAGPIPGLVEDDIPKPDSPISPQPRSTGRSEELSTLSRRESLRRYTAEQGPARDSGAPPSPRSHRSSPLATPIDTKPNPLEQAANTRLGHSPRQEGEEGLGIRRPAVQPSTSAPVRPISYVDRTRRYSNASLKAPIREALPATSSGQEAQSRARTKSETTRPLTDEEKTAQDLAFERDYIVIDKMHVEVNALADQISLYPQQQAQQAQSPKSGQIVRRATQQGAPTSTTGAVPAHSSSSRNTPLSQQQQQQQQQQQADHNRKPSYDNSKALSSSPGTKTSVISKAIQDASLRFFGFKYAAPTLLGKGASPPQIYSPFPAYPTPSSAPTGLLLADGAGSVSGSGSGKQTAGGGGGSGSAAPVDEDARVAQRIEEYATRSDVVYGFAEVKYKQLVPLAPSVEHGLGGVPADRMGEVPEGLGGGEGEGAGDRDDQDGDGEGGVGGGGGLTVEAVVALSEEALVLYVKALSLLAKSIDIAGMWWNRKSRAAESAGSSAAARESANTQAQALKINAAVQWIRARFNEVLEKAEVVRLKLLEAQKQLPEEHPAHPGNRPFCETGTGGGAAAGGGFGSAEVVLSPGLSAEKLMYDRAVEMSRAAAINEIASVDLPGCELSYATAIRMLEAVLDSDDDHLPRRRASSTMTTGTSSSRDEKQPAAGGGGGGAAQDASGEMSNDDKQTVKTMVNMINGRLHSLRKRMHVIAAASKAQQQQQQQMMVRRRSGDVTPRSVPT